MEGVRRGRMGRGKGRGVPLLRDVTVLAVMLCLLENLQGALAGTVYFNSYGHCIKGRQGQYFSLQDESYTLLATGAMEIHETLICMVTFQAPPDAGVCLTFRDYLVEDCGVSLDLYQGPTASGKRWKSLTCEDQNPPQMCTPERHVTVRLAKRKLNKNRGYSFTINVETSSSFKGDDVFLASSIGLFVIIIAAVVGIIVVIAVIVLCCCCRNAKCQLQPAAGGGGGGGKGGDLQSPPPGPPVQPSAPPAPDLEDESTPLQAPGSGGGVGVVGGGGGGGALYPGLPHPYPAEGYRGPEEPPPYAPPPYELHDFADRV